MSEELTKDPEWPREITIRATIETVKRDLGEDYDDENEGDDALLVAQGESMDTQVIHRWEDLEIPDGYEIVGDDDRNEYDSWLDSK